MKNKRFSFRSAALSACCVAALSACGGSDNSSSVGGSSTEGGYAPASLSGEIHLTPLDANVNGAIILTNTPARVAYFNQLSTAASTVGAYTGNYTYTKCGPNMVELKLDNVRTAPIQAPADQHWTIIGYMTFVSADQVLFTGTETFVANGTGDAGANTQGPIGTRNFSLNYTFSMSN